MRPARPRGRMAYGMDRRRPRRPGLGGRTWPDQPPGSGAWMALAEPELCPWATFHPSPVRTR